MLCRLGKPDGNNSGRCDHLWCSDCGAGILIVHAWRECHAETPHHALLLCLPEPSVDNMRAPLALRRFPVGHAKGSVIYMQVRWLQSSTAGWFNSWTQVNPDAQAPGGASQPPPGGGSQPSKS